MGKNKNRDRKQQQEQRQQRGTADRPAEQQPSMEGQSQAMRPEGSPSTARKGRQKSFGHN